MIYKSKKILKSVTLLLLLFFIVNNTFAQSVNSSSYNLMLNSLLERNVREIDVDSLWNNFDDFVLLDSRAPKEFEVSSIKGAHHVGYDQFSVDNLPDMSKEQPIVVYCSVGYRSEQITQKLNKKGFKNVYNLYGGIFEWVNRGHPVYDEGKSTERVHAYSKVWGIWLNKGEKVYN